MVATASTASPLTLPLRSQTEKVYQAIGKRYGIVGKVFNLFSKLRGGSKRTIGLELRAA